MSAEHGREEDANDNDEAELERSLLEWNRWIDKARAQAQLAGLRDIHDDAR